MKKSKLFIIKSFYSIVMLLILASCAEKQRESIRIGILDGPSAVSFIQVINNPPIIGGKQVEIVIKDEPIQIQAMMMKGELDFAILPTIMAANMYNKGIDFKMIACPIWGTLYLLENTEAKINNRLDKPDISVFGQGGTSDILLQRNIENNKTIKGNIDYSFTSNSDIAQALLTKKIKYGVVSEPLVSNLIARDSSIKILTKITCEEFINNGDKDIFVQTAFIVSQRFIDKYPALVEPVCSSYYNSCNFIYEQPDSAANLIVKQKLSESLTTASKTISLCNIRYVGAFAIEVEINKYLNIFYEYNPKSIGGKVPNKEFIYRVY